VRTFLAPPAERPTVPTRTPTFSVVIPVYNAAATVGEAIESVLRQTAAAHEVIVCDDGSTDGLDDAIAPYRERVVFVRKENGGGASALNAAAALATGEFVALVDSDDAYLPERLEALTELVTVRPDLDLLTTDAVYEVDGREVGRFNGPANPFAVARQREAILERCFIFAPAVRRARLHEVGGWDESVAIAYDWDLWLRLILGGSQAGSVDEPLVRYRLHDASLSARRAESLRERVAILERARSHPGLAVAERMTLAASLAGHRRNVLLAEAQESIRAARPDARARALAIARERGFGRRTRLRALFLANAPASVRARLLGIAGFGPRSERRQVTEDAGA
jgi:glycosyltransferase involved in cell wall biosynthesis